jgi:D-ribose pyranase
MKKGTLINAPLSSVIAEMGHLDQLMITDAGLPIPKETCRIDLAVTPGIPRFLEVVRAVLSELKVESAIVAEEMESKSPAVYKDLLGLLDGIQVKKVSHEELKRLTSSSRAVVRTGEFTPYANVILVSGVVF